MVEKPTSRPPYIEVGLETQILMREGQNIADQSPFHLLSREIGLPDDFFIEDFMAGRGAFVRCLVLEKHNWLQSWKFAPLTHVAPFVNRKYHTSTLEVFHQAGVQFIDSFAYLKKYLEDSWAIKLYDVHGKPKPDHPATKMVYPRFTFAGFQAKERGDLYAGLEEVLPVAFETSESLAAFFAGQGKRSVNTQFRVRREYTGNNG